VGYLADKIDISKKEAKLTINELNALIVRELKKEGSIRFAGLGIFRKRKLKARIGRPATGEQIKDSGAHAAALHPRQGAQGLCIGRSRRGCEDETDRSKSGQEKVMQTAQVVRQSPDAMDRDRSASILPASSLLNI
jgi:nucleoid DNA-binding protein